MRTFFLSHIKSTEKGPLSIKLLRDLEKEDHFRYFLHLLKICVFFYRLSILFDNPNIANERGREGGGKGGERKRERERSRGGNMKAWAKETFFCQPLPFSPFLKHNPPSPPPNFIRLYVSLISYTLSRKVCLFKLFLYLFQFSIFSLGDFNMYS